MFSKLRTILETKRQARQQDKDDRAAGTTGPPRSADDAPYGEGLLDDKLLDSTRPSGQGQRSAVPGPDWASSTRANASSSGSAESVRK